jgi:hypothetical protein
MNVSHYSVVPGAREQPLLGTLSADATGVAFGVAGDVGYFSLPAGIPDTETPTLPSFNAKMAFSASLPPGELTLVGHAVDDRGRFGPARTVTLTVLDAPEPSGALVITLTWDRPADLDLHVVEPSGNEIWADRPVGDGHAGALDLDSNGGCILDGRDAEHVVYAGQAPPGHYVVRVDTPSLCGQPVAYWRAQATAAGQRLAEAAGSSVDADTRGPHERGAGRTAFELDLP